MSGVGIDEAGPGLEDALERLRKEGEPLRLEQDGKPVAVLLSVAELERLEQLASIAEAAAPGMEKALFDQTCRMAGLGYWQWDIALNRYTACSDEMARLFGMTVEGLVDRMNSADSFYAMLHPEDLDRVTAIENEALASKSGYEIEYRIIRDDGSEIHVQEVCEPRLDGKGALIGQAGFIQDITQRKVAERELAERETLLRSIYTQLPGTVYRRIVNEAREIRYDFVSVGVQHLLGISAEELVANPRLFVDSVHPDDKKERAAAVRQSAEELTRYDAEYRFTKPTGEEVWIRAIADPEKLENGDVAWTGLTLDITDRKRLEEELRASRDALEQRVAERTVALREANTALQHEIDERREAEDALRESEERFRRLIDHVPASILLKDTTGRFRLANSRFCERYGVNRRSVLGKTDYDIHPPELAEAYKAQDVEVLETGKVRQDRFTVPYADGTEHIVDVIKFPVMGALGETVGIGSISIDVTERERAASALADSETRLRVIADNMPALITHVGSDGCFRFMNRRGAEWYARPAEELIGLSVLETNEAIYSKASSQMQRAQEGESAEFETRVTYPDGVTRDVRINYIPHRTADSGLDGYFSLVEDITAIKQAEERARQSQKMEAVGQLTGGVSHDFNNLLAVIIGNAEMLDEDTPDDPSVGAILRAARRGTELTQRLLAFSRRQPLDSRPTDILRLAEDMSAILHRTLGETIEVVISGEDGLWPAMADAGQVENALLNLAINARDAMPGGGKLTVECLNARLDAAYAGDTPDAEPGDYVLLAVSDTGDGMAPDVLEHAFEPFFTTKEVGQGTGLGLSMIYGFAKQSGGHVAIYSEAGRGACVKLYLPRSREGAVGKAREKDAELPQGNGETILIVEDSPDVRELVVKILSGLGYKVLEAGDTGDAAGVFAESAGEIDLLLSDVVLPGPMSGPEFAREARRGKPALKLLFMSGYPAEAARRNGFPDLDGPLLKKPLDRRELATALRDALKG